MLKLRVILLAGALAVATVPALAIDLPDYGSKNFSPSGDTPSYFANEAAPVSARTADTTQHDWSAVDEMAETEQNLEGTRSAYTHGGRHGRYSVAHGPSRHTAGKYGGTTRSARASAAGGYAGRTAHNSAAQTRNVSAARTTTPKHGKPGARHASAAGAHYIVN
jgi:hypothetical protein